MGRPVSTRKNYTLHAERIGRLHRALDQDSDRKQLGQQLCQWLTMLLATTDDHVREVETMILTSMGKHLGGTQGP